MITQFSIHCIFSILTLASRTIVWNCIDESKHYVTNQYHPEHYGLYLIAGKYSGWQKTAVYLYRTWEQHMFYSDLKPNLFHKK